MSSTTSLVEQIQSHAMSNYNDPKVRWDIVVESYTFEELEAAIGKCRTFEGAVKKMKAILKHSRVWGMDDPMDNMPEYSEW